MMRDKFQTELITALQPFERFGPVSVNVLSRSAGTLYVRASCGAVILIQRNRWDVRGTTPEAAVGHLLDLDVDRLVETFRQFLLADSQTSEHPLAALQLFKALKQSNIHHV